MTSYHRIIFWIILQCVTITVSAFSQVYDPAVPAKTYHLPDVLSEISGIEYLSNNILACIQDENGIIFYYDLDTARVVAASDFKKRGDYEDLVYYKGKYYILKSNGTLIRVKKKGDKWDADKIKNNIQAKEFEAICYDPGSGDLLISPKGKVQNKKGHSLVIYRLKIKKKKMQVFRLFTLKKSEYDNFFPEIKGEKLKVSGIAVHPGTRHIYLLSASHHLILVINRKGEVQHSYSLDPLQYPQPEGICFSPQGVLYISSESVHRAATISEIMLK